MPCIRSRRKVSRRIADYWNMAIFEWQQAYATGIPQIDAQHRKLFSLADELQTAMAGGKGKQVMAQLLQNLISYTRSHFAMEEQIMERAQFPGLAAHRLLHEELTRKVLELQRSFDSGNSAVLSIETMTFLNSWLRHHIGNADSEYVPFVKRQ